MGRRYEIVAPGTGRLIEEAVPQPGPGQAVVRVHANGLCASGLPVWTGERDHYPLSPGHEPVGVVVAVGAGVAVDVGTRVTGRITSSFADYAVADAGDLVPVPDAIPTDLALGEPLGCVAEALRRTPVHLADRVAVVGLGFMGLCMLQLVLRSPTAQVLAIDLRADARAAAAAAGADATGHPDDLATPAVAGDGFDVVIEATGAQGKG